MSEADILTFKRGKSFWIVFNRPKRRNAIFPSSYKFLRDILNKVNEDESIMYTVFTGNGEFYSSGSDFGPKAMEVILNDDYIGYEVFVDALIDHRKPIIALVNGPAIGIGCTMLTLVDYVVVSEKAYFLCPFTAMGLCPEGTSSKAFEHIMGYPTAARLALFSEKVTAEEAVKAGLATKMLSAQNFEAETRKLVERLETLGPQSLVITKELMRGKEWRDKMHAINKSESAIIYERIGSKETLERMIGKFGPKL